jgi:mono/diheme cytochrome c family protein
MRLRPAFLALLGLPLVHAAEPVSFSRQIRPILSENCIACHGPDEKARKAKLRLDDEASAKADRKGDIAIVPGKPELSSLIQRIESKDPEEVMPPPKQHKTISPEQLALLKTWIAQGAPWGKHWSYEPVTAVPVPANGEANPIDAFLLERLRQEKLGFSARADQTLLIRRTSLDLTGLPPTPAELTRFARAPQGEIVDHYLAQPSFGEHWARGWLDLARYADSAGYPSDPGRSIWPYRDWVIRALNANQPYDRFTIEQLAGDLLPNPTQDQLIATAFHRNTMTQNEGGTSDEEFRVAAVIDRVNTTYAVWMGTTMACAQCHTHKYDPITQTEYFRSYAILNQSADSDKGDERPTMEVIAPEQKTVRDGLQRKLAEAEAGLARRLRRLARVQGQHRREEGRRGLRAAEGKAHGGAAQATAGSLRPQRCPRDQGAARTGRPTEEAARGDQGPDCPRDAGTHRRPASQELRAAARQLAGSGR